MNQLCVIIPIYKNQFNENEIISVNTYKDYFEHTDIFFLAPERLDCEYYVNEYPEFKIEKFDNKFFKNAKSYNKLMLNQNFYERFISYEYLLIAHTDAIIFNAKADMEEVLNYGYDYIGAPWYTPIITGHITLKNFIKRLVIHKPEVLKSGNGGFSLRKVKTLKELVEAEKYFLKIFWHFNEDIYFAYRGSVGRNRIKVAPQSIGERFALEEEMKTRAEELNPIALHAWEESFDSIEEINDIKRRCNKQNKES